MNYNFMIIDMCDECRLTLQRNLEITSKYRITEMDQGGVNTCRVCGLANRFTRSVLTDYAVPCEDIQLVSDHDLLASLRHRLKEISPRTVNDGFMLLWIEDELAR